MAFFDNLTTSLKLKWLQFFQENRSWIVLQMEVESVYTPDGGRRPSSFLILGVVNALEPQIAQLMLPFSKLNPDADSLIDVLELNFDPDLVLGNRFIPQAVLEELSNESLEISDEEVAPILQELINDETVIETLTELELDELSDMMADEVVLVSDDESIVVLNVAVPDAPGEMTLDEMADIMGIEESDDKSPETPSVAQPDESGDVSSDVWAEGTSSESKPAEDKTVSGEEKQSERDEEISRLFPND